MSEDRKPAFIAPAKPILGEEEVAAVAEVIRSGMVAQGPQVAAFEAEFSEQVAGGAHAVAVNSGTSALHLGLLAAGIGPGDEVLVPSFTFAATANSVAITGATPVFVDIESEYFCMDPADAAARVTERTKAIMPVHLYGHPADMPRIEALAEERGLAVFEDAAQAHLASLDGQEVGTFGLFAAFSLYPTKNMTSGEGGMVTTGSDEIARRVRVLRNQGMERQYANEMVGLNNRMTDIHAAIGRTQLRHVADWTATRQANAAFLDANLRGVIVPPVAAGAVHVYHQYTIRVDAAERDRMVQAMREEHGVGSGVYYPIPNHRLDSLRHFAPDLELPKTEKAAAEVISLPVHPSLTRANLERIVEAVNATARAGA